MSFAKYVEITWEKIELPADVSPPFYLNISTHFPTPNQNNISEKMLDGIKTENHNGQICLFPNHTNKLIFAGYIRDFLEVAIDIFQQQSTLVHAHLEVAQIAFSGILRQTQKYQNFVAKHVFQLHQNTSLGLNGFYSGEITTRDYLLGKIALNVHIKPQLDNIYGACEDVYIFPVAERKIAVYYMGDLVETNEIHVLWTLSGWKSNNLSKMKKLPHCWFSLIELPETEVKHLELAFTNANQEWDNNNDQNWIFEKFYW